MPFSLVSICPIVFEGNTSIPPLLMPHRQAVELVPIEPPLGHEPVKEIDEAGVVGGFQQMGHFMDHDVFKAFLGFLG